MRPLSSPIRLFLLRSVSRRVGPIRYCRRPAKACKTERVWAQLSIWRVQDGQLDELAVGDTWNTRLEVNLDEEEQVDPSTPLGLGLVGDPLTDSGPRYECVARVLRDDVFGTFLDVGNIVVAPSSLSEWPVDTVLRFQSELSGSEAWFSEPPDPLIRSWRVSRLFIRYKRAVPTGEPRSWRPGPTDVLFREVDRMSMWEDATGPIGPGRMSPVDDGPRMSDYLLEIDRLSH
jgi:hypothetical protein